MIRDIILGAIALAFGAVYMREAAKIPRSALGDAVGAGGVPLILGGIMCACGLLLILRTLALRRSGGVDTAEAGPASISAVFDDPKRLMLMAGGVIGLTIAYFALLNLLGYILSMALYLLAVLRFQGVGLTARSAGVAVGGAVGLWLLFDSLLGVDLPEGLLAGVF